MYKNLGVHWASSVPAFLSLACLPLPFLFYKFGHFIRMKSKYASEAKRIMDSILNQQKPKAEEVEKSLEAAEDSHSGGTTTPITSDKGPEGTETQAHNE